jgi:AraC family transcriptional regulator
MIAEPEIKTIQPIQLVGKKLKMNLLNNRVPELWRNFMPRKNEIRNAVSDNLFSVQVFAPEFDFMDFNLHTEFERWAAREVSDFDHIPEEMECYSLPGGLYAVFHYKGRHTDFQKTFEYIFNIWFPASHYVVDKREHFEVLGEKYKNNDPESEEDIWIPVKKKNT